MPNRKQLIVFRGMRFNGSTVGIVHLGRDRGCGARDYGSDGGQMGTLMRHFLSLPCAPSALARSMLKRPAIAPLIAFPGAAHRLTPAYEGAHLGAVQVPVITMSTDLSLAMTTFARIQPMGLWTLRHAPSTRDWTPPCDARIKAARMRFYRRRHVEGPGF
jgi:hypothetical protein